MSVAAGHPAGRWRRVEAGFLACHSEPLNVAIHLVTTPLALWALIALGAKISAAATVAVTVVYLIVLLGLIPVGVWWATALAAGVLVVGAVSGPVTGLGWLLGALALAYGAQDLAHRLSGEETYESCYAERPDGGWRRAEHSLLLLPLVLAAARRTGISLLSWIVPRRSVLVGRLDRDADRARLALIRRWVRARRPCRESTTHWWAHELDPEARRAFEGLVDSDTIAAMLRTRHGGRARVRPVPAMNEVYVAGPDRGESSDRVFYVPHVDGPLAVFPGATLYRCMVAVTPNRRIRTHFPMERRGPDEEAVTLDEAELLAFDYHRTPHFISVADDEEPQEQRVNLKLHYVVSPAGLAGWAELLARASARYNLWARRLFLDTLVPDVVGARVAARLVVLQTHLWQWIARWLGHRNLALLAALALLSQLTGSPVPFVVGASFVHYLLYIATYASREQVSFGVFRRDVLFFKSVSMSLLAVLALSSPTWSPAALLLMVAGFGTAAWAAGTLGADRTWFGAELGICEPRRVGRIPYGVIPHPMILGSIVGLVGVSLLEPLRTDWPWLVPCHVGFYLVHLAQEILDLHEPRPLSATPDRS